MPVRNKRIIEVAEIVVDRAAARHTPYNFYSVFPDESLIDLLGSILVLPDNDGIVVLPQ